MSMLQLTIEGPRGRGGSEGQRQEGEQGEQLHLDQRWSQGWRQGRQEGLLDRLPRCHSQQGP